MKKEIRVAMNILSLTFQDEVAFLGKLTNELLSLPHSVFPSHTLSLCRNLLANLLPRVSEEKGNFSVPSPFPSPFQCGAAGRVYGSSPALAVFSTQQQDGLSSSKMGRSGMCLCSLSPETELASAAVSKELAPIDLSGVTVRAWRSQSGPRCYPRPRHLLL